MLWNNFHRLVLFQHIQFQLLVLTAAPNLKINATAAFQIICNIQKKNTSIMDRKNPMKAEQTVKKCRSSRSISSPSRTEAGNVLLSQRPQSLLGLNNLADSNWHTCSMPNVVANPLYHNAAGGAYFQQPWNTNFLVNRCPMPSSSNVNYQYRQIQTLPPSNSATKITNGNKRRWESISSHNKGNNGRFSFTLMSYNVLAQDLVQNHVYLYREHNPQALQWEVRWINILKEIGDANPDIICFQEVQESHLDNYFSVLEKKLGYKSIFKKRTGIRTDGCAIFYKRKRLQLMEYEKVEYYQENVSVLNRDNVAIVARFIPKEVHSHAFVVATTHLLYNPRRQDVRLAQVQNLIAEIDKMAFICLNENGEPSYLPVIVTGDFNSTPDSAVYEFITRGILNYQNLSKRLLTKESGKELNGKVLVPESLQMTDNCQYAEMVRRRINGSVKEDLKFCSGILSHPFSFKSAYKHYRNNDIEGTTFQDRWITVDYIFYSGKKRGNSIEEDKLKLLSRYQLLTKNQLSGTRIPNLKLGSDHFSLVVKFSLE